MGNYRARKTLCFLLALWFVLCSPTSSRAFLTELVVGGHLLLEVGSTIVAAAPQLALLGGSLLTLAKTSDEIASTLSRIISFFLPKKKDATATTAPSGSQPTESVSVAGGSSGDEDLASNAVSPSNDGAIIVQLLQRFLLSHAQQRSLYEQLSAMAPDDPMRAAVGAGYGELVSQHASLEEKLVTGVIDAVVGSQERAVSAFEAKILSLGSSDRKAMQGVFEQVLRKGRAFSSLHRGGDGSELFARLEKLSEL